MNIMPLFEDTFPPLFGNPFGNLQDKYWRLIQLLTFVLFFIFPLLAIYYSKFVLEQAGWDTWSTAIIYPVIIAVVSLICIELFILFIAYLYFRNQGYPMPMPMSLRRIFSEYISGLLIFALLGLTVYMMSAIGGTIIHVALNTVGVVNSHFGVVRNIFILGITATGYILGLVLGGNGLWRKADNAIQEWEDAQQLLEDGTKKVDSGEFRAAREELKEAQEILQAALTRRRDSKRHRDIGLNDEIQQDLNRVMAARSSVEKNLITDEATSMQSTLDHIEELLGKNECSEAAERLSEMQSTLDSINERISEYDIDGFENEIEEIEQRCEALVKEKERKKARIKLSDDVESIRATIEHGDARKSQAELEELASDIESAKRTAEEYNLDNIFDEIISLEKHRQKILDKIEQKKNRHRLQDELDTLRSKFEQADALAEQKEFKKAKTTLDELASNIKSVKETATQYNFDDLHQELTTLEQQRENRLKDVTERLKANPVPDTIPRAPKISVDYNALTDREPIGGGGSADVMRATHPTPSGDVTLAIKEPRMGGTLHTEVVERLLEEAETWDKLDDHDHIVGVVDYGTEPMPWIAMEYMNAGHLGEKSDQIDISQALWTAVGITKGVHHAHRRGVAHLDLKPENVLFRSVEGAWNVPKVADWGLSRHLLNHSKSVEGLSPQYAAPEQFDEDFGSADDLTDIYQLGAVFYELFTGQPPFDGKPAKAMHKVLHEEPTAPSEIADVPNELDEILLTALAKEKDDRYDGILYLRDELQELFDNQ